MGIVKNLTFICIAAICCSIAFAAGCSEGFKGEEDPEKYSSNDVNLNNINKSKIIRAGGSNYPMIGIGKYINYDPSTGAPSPWFEKDQLLPVLGYLHKFRPFVEAELKNMDEAGQKSISLPIWYLNQSQHSPESLTYGHTLNLKERSRFSNLTAQNLRDLLDMVENLGFNQFTLRFAPQGAIHPKTWGTQWNEQLFQRNWNLIVNTKKIIAEKKRKMRILWDIGLEMGGLTSGQLETYQQKMWANYTYVYGTKDTIGFSVAFQAGRVKKMMEIYDRVGVRPKVIAIDIYTDIDDKLGSVADELKQSQAANIPIIIQETSYNDAATYDELVSAKKKYDLKIVSINQWPKHKNSVQKHFSMHYPEKFNHYLGRAHIRKANVGCADQSCLLVYAENISRDAVLKLMDPNTNEIIETHRNLTINTRLDNIQVIKLQLLNLSTLKRLRSSGLRIGLTEPGQSWSRNRPVVKAP